MDSEEQRGNSACRKIDRLFHPEMPEEEREELYAGWVNCVESLMIWSKSKTVVIIKRIYYKSKRIINI